MEVLLEKCQQIVEGIYNQFDASHDFAHIERVLKNAEEILQQNRLQMGKLFVWLCCYMILTMPNIKRRVS